ncbi:MAG: 2-oxoacid:acceptor oxidoreductase family protein [Chloroflexota bacterium]|nr:2-oxoacid:acceptor oxidoreductase family protein [Chloroflexota bacterium]
MKDDLIEIRWHGRGGQGAVTASEILAEAALEEGKYFQAFPDYGPERMGAPVRAYTRVSISPIRQHCQITHPDAVVVLDPTLIGVVDFTEGLRDGGAVVINTTESPSSLKKRLKFKGGKLFTIDATRIAMDTIGRNIPNTPLIGAVLKVMGGLSKESVLDGLKKKMGSKVSAKLVQANVEAFERAYNEVKGE